MIKFTFLSLTLFFQSLFAQTNYESTGRFFKIGEKSDKPLFIQTTQVTFKPGEKNTASDIKDANGQVVMTETAQVVNGQIVKQVMTQLQINERYELQQEPDKETYTFKTYDIKDKEQPKLVSENKIKTKLAFYTGPSMVDFLYLNREKLKSGQKEIMAFGVFELQKLIDFSVQKTKSSFVTDQNTLISLKMKIDNMLFAFFVDPLIFDIHPDTGRLVNYRGRTPVRIQNKNGDYKPFDADIYYEYK